MKNWAKGWRPSFILILEYDINVNHCNFDSKRNSFVQQLKRIVPVSFHKLSPFVHRRLDSNARTIQAGGAATNRNKAK